MNEPCKLVLEDPRQAVLQVLLRLLWMDGGKLPLFCIFKGEEGQKIQRTPDAITIPGIVCALQERSWIDG